MSFICVMLNINRVLHSFCVRVKLKLICDYDEQTNIDIYVFCKMSFCLNSKSKVCLFCPVLAYLTSAVSNETTITIGHIQRII